jgi:hypothetical protein
MRIRGVVLCASLCLWSATANAAPATIQGEKLDGVTLLMVAIERAVEAGDDGALRALAVNDIEPAQLSEFVQSLTFLKVSSLTIKERDRVPVEGGRQRLLIEIFAVRDAEGQVSTWRLDAAPPQTADGPWRIGYVERLSVVGGLFHLGLDTAVEWDVHNAVVNAPDLTLTIPSGYAFASRASDGTTAMVFLGRGNVEFSPGPAAERGQVRIFSGSDALKTDFNALFVRLNPAEFSLRVSQGALKPRTVDANHLRKATEVFDNYVTKSFQLDLNDLSARQWSLVPSTSDFVAEIVTGRYGALTYARATSEPEDISFFDRRRKRNIAVYTSEAKLASRGRFFSEDDRLDYDVIAYDIDAAFAPERLWIDGTARISIRTRASFLTTLTLRLADSLVVRNVTSPQFGRLLHLRVVGQNNVLVGFPATLPPETPVDLIVTYGGRLPAQNIDREAVTVSQERQEEIVLPPEPHWAYSNRSYWYPQSTVSDYATAKLTLTVPGELDVVASGTQQGPPTVMPAPPGQRGRKKFVFESSQPARYLACLISRFQSAGPVAVRLRDDEKPVVLTVLATPRQFNKSRQLTDKASEILTFYGMLMGDAPYDSFTLALVESDLPGGHSPAYFAMLNQPLPTSPFAWNNDPVAFPGYPSFFIAHEIAHQWWGQAVGWKNYHEQWLSEGFAQYFAALFAEKERGADQFESVIRQMRRWAIRMSPQGPIYLGYRLGHIRADSRVFRALVYNKGALVLHMLRRLIGDEAFFAGLRDFATTWRYKKAGTDDLRVSMEKAGGRPLERFFDRWIFNSGIPVIHFTSMVDTEHLRVRFVQSANVYDVPVTVTITYLDGTTQDVLVVLTEQTTERSFPLKGKVKSVEANKDGGALAEIEK